ncbi:Uncharacterized protein SCF082_LOCUS36896, partial [Durusdinium trenchii]
MPTFCHYAFLRLHPSCFKVAAKQNIGEHLNDRYINHLPTSKAIEKYVDPYPCCLDGKPCLGLVPQNTVEEFYLPLRAFDFSSRSKNGYFPNNGGICLIVNEFMHSGYSSGFDAIKVKFPMADDTREVKDWTTGVVDGQTRILACLAIISCCAELELVAELVEEIRDVLGSFKLLRCSYKHFENPGHHYLHSLKIGYITSEKVAPSAIQIVADLKSAIGIEQRMNRGRSQPLKDILGRVTSEYNKMVSIKRHRIDTTRKNLAYNLLRSPSEVMQLVHRHYDTYVHHQSGLPLEILALDFWVPEVSTRMETPRFANAKVFKEILSTSEQTCLVYIKRAVADFERATGPGSTAKAKKNAMLSEEDHLALHDNCCLWTWLLPKLQNEFQGQTVEKYQDLFYKGSLDADLGSVMKAAVDFDWERLPFVLEIKGRTMEDYVIQNQDRARNARAKSIECAYNAWTESWMRHVMEDDCISVEDHSVILWLNCPCIGILPTLKYDFFLTFISNMLAEKKSMKKEDADDDVKDETKAEEGDSDHEENELVRIQGEEAELRDVIYRKDLQLPERGLSVRKLTWIFDPASPQTKGAPLPHLGREMTVVQEMKQVGAGTDILKKTVASFCVPTSKTNVLIDMHAYDSFPAFYALELQASRKTLCASLSFDSSGAELLTRVSQRLYEGCRDGSMVVNGFPDFNAHIAALKESTASFNDTPTYKVCQQQHDRLLLLQSFARKWVEEEITKERALAVVDAHNKAFNCGEGADYWAADETTPKPDGAVEDRPKKRIKIDGGSLLSNDDVAALQKP